MSNALEILKHKLDIYTDGFFGEHDDMDREADKLLEQILVLEQPRYACMNPDGIVKIEPLSEPSQQA